MRDKKMMKKLSLNVVSHLLYHMCSKIEHVEKYYHFKWVENIIMIGVKM